MMDISKIRIQEAVESDAEKLTEIAFAAKRHWKYPESYYDLWKNELTIIREYIQKNTVYKALVKNVIIGFYSIISNPSDFYSGETFVKQGYWLEHIFIHPDYHGAGIGRLLMQHAVIISKQSDIPALYIFVDPYAQGFYDKIGAEYLYSSKSSIPGRIIPVYGLKIGRD